MPIPRWLQAKDIGEAVNSIVNLIEDTHERSKVIYFDGWDGLAASAVLRAIAEDPPQSLLRNFRKIIQIDCSRWKSRRALQREIAQEIKLPPSVMAIFDKQDEEDDFTGVHQGSRNEIKDVGAEIHRALREDKYLLVFHNGSNATINLSDFGIPQLTDQWSAAYGSILLWTFRGRLRLKPETCRNIRMDDSYRFAYCESNRWNNFLQDEAREIARYTDKRIGEEVAEECCLYLLALNSQGGDTVDYNWAIHVSNYWVCDGIIQGGQHDDEAWEVAAALHQQIHTEDYSSNTVPFFSTELMTPAGRWMFSIYDSAVQGSRDTAVHPETTSFFLAVPSGSTNPPPSQTFLPNGMFHQSDNLRVLKLCRCTFSFSSPPFHGCRSLRFLGLDDCKDDKPQELQDEKNEEIRQQPALEIFQSLWVLDICHMYWELALSPEIIDQMAANIREVHIKKGRFWRRSFKWRQLQNLRKLRVIEPTCPWETGEKDDEFTEMVKLELLDLSGNSTIRVLPSLSEATSLKTIVLDGCVGLEHVGPQGLPPSLESFSLHAGSGDKAKISLISLVGSPRLINFRLRGSLPNLEELDLSGTSIKTLDLDNKNEVVQVPCLQRVMLFGCEQLRAVVWPKSGMSQLRMLCIETGGVEVGRRRRTLEPFDCNKDYCEAHVGVADMRFLQSLLLFPTSILFGLLGNKAIKFCWNNEIYSLNLCMSAAATSSSSSSRDGSLTKITGPPTPDLPKAMIPRTYVDVPIDKIKATDHDYVNSALMQSEPPPACHVEIGEGISYPSVKSIRGVEAVIFVMESAVSLHVHSNSSITKMMENNRLAWSNLECCRVERCPKLHTVFTPNYEHACFQKLEIISASHLLMAHCIWSKGKMRSSDSLSFQRLQIIHLYSCPRLTFVLQLLYFQRLSSLETLYIVNCGDLEQVFPVEAEFRRQIATEHQNGVLEFSSLRHIYLHQLFKLRHICEAKMFAPKLETIWLRGCWGLRRLPAVVVDGPDTTPRRRPIVDCEKDYWEKLEWDGLEVGHHPSLFDPRHSSYYKKPLPRVSVLR